MDFDVTSISAMVAAAGVLIGAVYYILDMRNQTRIRKTDMLMRLYSTEMGSQLIDAQHKLFSLQVKDYEDYVKQYGPLSKDSPMSKAFFTIIPYHEMVGLLLYRKLVDIITVWDIWGSTEIIRLLEKVKPLVMQLRKEDPSAYLGFEYLCGELKREEPQLKKRVNQIRQKIYVPE